MSPRGYHLSWNCHLVGPCNLPAVWLILRKPGCRWSVSGDVEEASGGARLQLPVFAVWNSLIERSCDYDWRCCRDRLERLLRVILSRAGLIVCNAAERRMWLWEIWKADCVVLTERMDRVYWLGIAGMHMSVLSFLESWIGNQEQFCRSAEKTHILDIIICFYISFECYRVPWTVWEQHLNGYSLKITVRCLLICISQFS